MLVILVFFSLVQDALWFIINRDIEFNEDDGGVEHGVRQFSRYMSYISFGWRVFLAVILWKISLDFVRIVKRKNVDGKEPTLE